MIDKIIFGTRGSPLALIQTNIVIGRLKNIYPDISYGIKVIETKGDKDREISLTLSEQLGLFSSEIQSELLDGNIDAAVHSLKDVPINNSKRTILSAIPERLDESDLLFHPRGYGIKDLAIGAVVGTCSLRRKGQLLNLRNDLIVKEIRGNIATRIEKVMSGKYEATILASAGLIRLGYDISKYYIFPLEEIIPAPGQGALVVETKEKDHRLNKIISQIDNIELRREVQIERAIMHKVGGGCSMPIGIFIKLKNDRYDAIACYADPYTGIKNIIQYKKWKGSDKGLIELISNKVKLFLN